MLPAHLCSHVVLMHPFPRLRNQRFASDAHVVGIEPTMGFPNKLTACGLTIRLHVNDDGRSGRTISPLFIRHAPVVGIEPPNSRETAERPPLTITGINALAVGFEPTSSGLIARCSPLSYARMTRTQVFNERRRLFFFRWGGRDSNPQVHHKGTRVTAGRAHRCSTTPYILCLYFFLCLKCRMPREFPSSATYRCLSTLSVAPEVRSNVCAPITDHYSQRHYTIAFVYLSVRMLECSLFLLTKCRFEWNCTTDRTCIRRVLSTN